MNTRLRLRLKVANLQILGCSSSDSKLEGIMDEVKRGIWIPTVEVCRHERTGDFKLDRMGATEDSGLIYSIGNLVPIGNEVMAKDGLRIILEDLNNFRIWPAKTKLESEVGSMNSRQLSKFVKEHKFVSILKRERGFLNLSPHHRIGRSLRGITAYLHEETLLPLPSTPEIFFQALTEVFEVAT